MRKVVGIMPTISVIPGRIKFSGELMPVMGSQFNLTQKKIISTKASQKFGIEPKKNGYKPHDMVNDSIAARSNEEAKRHGEYKSCKKRR